MAKGIANLNFLKDLALMGDILQEISILSLSLQSRGLTLPRAECLIKRTIKSIELLKSDKGFYNNQIPEKLATELFQEIGLQDNKKVVSLSCDKLLILVNRNLEKRLVERTGSVEEWINLVQPSSWSMENIVVPWRAAEEKNS